MCAAPAAGPAVTDVAMSPLGGHVAYGDDDGTFEIGGADAMAGFTRFASDFGRVSATVFGWFDGGRLRHGQRRAAGAAGFARPPERAGGLLARRDKVCDGRRADGIGRLGNSRRGHQLGPGGAGRPVVRPDAPGYAVPDLFGPPSRSHFGRTLRSLGTRRRPRLGGRRLERDLAVPPWLTRSGRSLRRLCLVIRLRESLRRDDHLSLVAGISPGPSGVDWASAAW